MSRGADEVRSWFGDDEARRRREMDEYRERAMEPRHRYEERGRGVNADRSWSGGGDWRREPEWSPSSSYSSGSSPSRGTTTGEGSWQYGSAPRSDFGRGAGGFSGSSGYTGGGYGSEGWSGTPPRSSSYSESYRSGAFGGPGSFAGRGPRNYQRSDERIREEVNERLTDDHRIDASDIEVEVRNGEVFLRGRVEERRDKRTAEEIVENLPGVKDVRNELRVERGGIFGGGDRDRQQADRNRQEGSLGHTGNPQQRDDVTSLNLSGASTQNPATAAGSTTGREKADRK